MLSPAEVESAACCHPLELQKPLCPASKVSQHSGPVISTEAGQYTWADRGAERSISWKTLILKRDINVVLLGAAQCTDRLDDWLHS